MSSFSKAFKIAQPLKRALRILFTQICFQWLQNMGKESAKIQRSHSNFVSPLVSSLRLNLQAENITHMPAEHWDLSDLLPLTHWLILFLPFLGQWVLTCGHFPGKYELQPTLPVNPVCFSCRWGKRTGFGAEPLSLAFMCAHEHVLALQNFTLEEKTFPWRQKGLGSTEHLLIIILTGFWPWALLFLFSKHFLWVWKAEVKLSLWHICVWKEHVKMMSEKQEWSQDFTYSLISHILQLRSLYGIVKMYQIPWVTSSLFHLGFFLTFSMRYFSFTPCQIPWI